MAALPNTSGEEPVVAILDPNREVDPRYVNYQIATAGGPILTGIVAAESPTSMTLLASPRAAGR